jgi:hypothetical protein
MRHRAATPVERSVSEQVFRATPPGVGEATFDGLPLAGGYAVLRLTGVQPGDPSSTEQARRDELRSLLARRRGLELATSYRDELRRQADVRIFEDRL